MMNFNKLRKRLEKAGLQGIEVKVKELSYIDEFGNKKVLKNCEGEIVNFQGIKFIKIKL